MNKLLATKQHHIPSTSACTLYIADLLTVPLHPPPFPQYIANVSACVCVHVYTLVFVFRQLQQALLSLHKLRWQGIAYCAHLSVMLRHVSVEVHSVCAHVCVCVCEHVYVYAWMFARPACPCAHLTLTAASM